MSTSKRKRMSMLDSLANAGAVPAASAESMMPGNRALKAAREAVDSHHVWELNPESISNQRPEDRLDPNDTVDLQDAIETNGQTVPILVRRDPANADRYLLVYGRRRLEAIKNSDKVTKVRALVTSMSEQDAVQAQISENMARRDLSFIEKALFANELIESGFGNQSQVAEVLTVTKSSISMALAIVDALTPDLIRAIGPAHGIGRPRWDTLARTMGELQADPDRLRQIADEAHTKALVATVKGEATPDQDNSLLAFEAVEQALRPSPASTAKTRTSATPKRRRLTITDSLGGSVKRTAKGVSIEVEDSAFAAWVESEAQDLMQELHARWLQRGEG